MPFRPRLACQLGLETSSKILGRVSASPMTKGTEFQIQEPGEIPRGASRTTGRLVAPAARLWSSFRVGPRNVSDSYAYGHSTRAHLACLSCGRREHPDSFLEGNRGALHVARIEVRYKPLWVRDGLVSGGGATPSPTRLGFTKRVVQSRFSCSLTVLERVVSQYVYQPRRAHRSSR